MKNLNNQIVSDIIKECVMAGIINGPFASLHEAESILREEFEEFVKEVRLKNELRSVQRIRTEAIHTSAVAMRIASQFGIQKRKR